MRRKFLTIVTLLIFSGLLSFEALSAKINQKASNSGSKGFNFFSLKDKKPHSLGLDLGGGFLGQDLIGSKTEFPTEDPLTFQKYVVFSGGMGWLP